MLLAFSKYHGLGNDFAFVDARALQVDLRGGAGARLCDRHRGIGADGLLLWTGSAADPEMTVVNNDGSVARMCGNGLRCFAKHLGDRILPLADSITVRTGAGPLRCVLQRDDHGVVQAVAVDMGGASWQPADVRLSVGSPVMQQPIVPGFAGLRFTALATGNPHAVTFDAVTAQERAELGPLVGALPLFAEGVNVEFAALSQGSNGPELTVFVYERGCGWTEACGTGATATTIEAARQGLVPFGAEITVHLPGGPLGITVLPDHTAVMRGPATWTYDGALRLADYLEA